MNQKQKHLVETVLKTLDPWKKNNKNNMHSTLQIIPFEQRKFSI